MIESIVALLMFVNGEIKEHLIQDNMAACLRGKREAEIQKCKVDGRARRHRGVRKAPRGRGESAWLADRAEACRGVEVEVSVSHRPSSL